MKMPGIFQEAERRDGPEAWFGLCRNALAGIRGLKAFGQMFQIGRQDPADWQARH